LISWGSQAKTRILANRLQAVWTLDSANLSEKSSRNKEPDLERTSAKPVAGLKSRRLYRT
jgi:hypothetical protein